MLETQIFVDTQVEKTMYLQKLNFLFSHFNANISCHGAINSVNQFVLCNK